MVASVRSNEVDINLNLPCDDVYTLQHVISEIQEIMGRKSDSELTALVRQAGRETQSDRFFSGFITGLFIGVVVAIIWLKIGHG